MSWKTKSTSSRRVPAAEMMIPGVELITRSCATAGAEVSAVAAARWPLVARYLGHVLEEVDEELAALRHAALRVAGTTTAEHNFGTPFLYHPGSERQPCLLFLLEDSRFCCCTCTRDMHVRSPAVSIFRLPLQTCGHRPPDHSRREQPRPSDACRPLATSTPPDSRCDSP